MIVSRDKRKEKLDQFTLDIEFLLISVIQGTALATLAAISANVVGNGQFQYVPYVVSSFLLILNFWSQAIIHALSFVDWPLDLTHNFFYFFASLIEVMAFFYLTDPIKYFAFISVFFVIAVPLYVFDLQLIKSHKKDFSDSSSKKELFHHMVKRQVFELKFLLPLALVFNIGITLVIFFFQDIFIKQHLHVLFGIFQAFFGFVVLMNSMKNFRRRSELIAQC